jgi:hypothetical protein
LLPARGFAEATNQLSLALDSEEASMSGIIAVVLDEKHHVQSVESDSRHLVGTKVLVVTPPESDAERVIFRVSGTDRPLERLYDKEEMAERRTRVGNELARLMYEASVVIKSERWERTEVEAFLDRLGEGVAALKRGLEEEFDPTDPLRQWAAWFDEAPAHGQGQGSPPSSSLATLFGAPAAAAE